MAQNSIQCEFCQTSSNLKWKCLECYVYLCQKCNSKYHANHKVFKHHNVVDIRDCGKDINAENVLKAQLKNIICSGHNDEKCFIFCKECMKPLCAICIVKFHNGHDICQLD